MTLIDSLKRKKSKNKNYQIIHKSGMMGMSNMATSSWGFYTALIGSALCGSMCSLGESVVVGFLKDFPAN